MNEWIRFPLFSGEASRQAHADLPPASFEREVGAEGFSGPSSHFYHRHPPTAWTQWEGPLRPRALDLTRLACDDDSPWKAIEIASSTAVRVRQWRCTTSMNHLVRNADGDDLIFVHRGAGRLFCDYGRIDLRDGDYLVIPRGTMWRIEPIDVPMTLLLIEATDDRYRLPARGLVGDHALFDPGVLAIPQVDEEFRRQQDQQVWRVVVKRQQRLTTIHYPHNPLDALGWKGTLAPVRLNWRDIRPLMSHRYHLPPSAHTTFAATHFVVATFVPRPIESDPGAIKVPFFHSNDDYDELVFFHRGQFFSRDNFGPGMMTFHPCGFPHGPHPKAFQVGASAARKETDEVAINIDSRSPITITAAAEVVELPGYIDSWRGLLEPPAVIK
jgi:homogentisate 1,2-dioxygenase